MSLLNIEGHSNLKKDTSSGGIVNVDKNSYQAYILQKTLAKRTIQQQQIAQESISHLQSQINSITGDLADVKTLLLQILQKGN